MVDTTDLAFIDSTGVGVLLEGRKERGPDRFTLIAGPATERVLGLAGLRACFGLD